MPNKNYEKGKRKEQKLVREARESGLIAFRSAGSHSPIDVCIINIKNKTIEFLQCKPKSMSKNAKEKLEKQYNEINDNFRCVFKVV